jgi:uncharacterized protein (DUF433 family)
MSDVMSSYIEQTPGTCGDKPRIAGTRIKVSLIAILSERNRLTPDEIVEAYPHLTLAQVHAALAYYWQHRDQIEDEIRADDEFVAAHENERDASFASPS